MSVTDTKEFIRMETAADKLGVDQVKLVRMMQDKKMMVRLEFAIKPCIVNLSNGYLIIPIIIHDKTNFIATPIS